ncbi:MAG: ribonucleoside-diphosphate reductase, adenosylcobalamin-dependent, partial [Candidatus Aenigmarchaeota archaeon ex4484_224]
NRRNILINARGPIRATNPCVTGDTLIPTEFGLISMKELVEKYPNGGIKIAVDNRVPLEIKFSNGSKILIQKSQKGISFYEITKAFSNGIKDVYKIETESGLEIKVTKEHKFYTKNGWKGIDELIPGIDSIYIQSGEIPFNRNKKLPFDVKNEFRGKNGRLYKFNFSKEWSKELGEVLGYLIGDGWLSDDKNYRVGLTFSEKTLLNYFKSILDKWYGKKIKFVKRENGVYHLSYHSKFFVDFFKKLGVKSVKAEEKEVPKTIFTATKEAVIGFLRGLFTADGTIQIDKNKGNYYIRLTSKSKKLLKQVQILLLSLGIKSKIYNRSRSPQVKFEYKTKDGKKKEYFVDGKLFELHISKENIPKFIQKIGFLESTKNKKVELLKDRSYHSEIFEDKVKKIEYVGKEEVFDLTEPLSKSFITNGLISLDCGEQPLHPYGSCNLGSINLYAFIKRENGKAEFDWEKLKDVVKKAVRFLDNVIDVNKFPLKKIERVSRESRNIGLGIMGLADTLFALQIPYNSEEGFEFMRKVIEFIAYHAFLESIELSKERGPFPIFEKSEYPKGEMPLEGFYRKEYWTQDWPKIPELIKQFGIRNSNIMSIAPTGSISMIMDTSSGLEPQFALTFEKSVTVGKFYYVDPEFEFQLKQRGLYREDILKKIADNGGSVQGLEEIPEDLKKVFVVAYDIPWWDHVRAQYEIGLWVDAGISKTINMPNWVTVEDVLNAYIFAYKLGLKGITIYRDGSKSVQVLITPSQRKGKYIRIVKNKTLELMKQFGIDISKYLEEINKSNNNSTFQTIIKPKLPLLTSPQQIDNQIKGEEKVEKVEGKVCPVCGSNRLIYREGCITCLDCGWSECTVG